MAKIVREVSSWTINKLDMLEEYLKAYVNATKRARVYGIYYLDLFAGCGKNRDKTTRKVKNGSPLIALELQPGFGRYFFIEGDRENYDSLDEYIKEYPQDTQERVRTYHGDCNLEIDRVLRDIPERNPTFAFLDPESIELHWATLEKLASHKKPSYNKIELFILFPYNMSLVRMLTEDPDVFEDRGYQNLLKRVMPPISDWQSLYKSKLSGKIDKYELRRCFTAEYKMGLERLGYKHVLLPRLFFGKGRRALYFMFFATDNDVGASIMLSRFQKPRYEEQLSMFGYSKQY